MKAWGWGAAAAGVLAAALTLGLASCGDDDKGAAAPPPQAPGLSPDPLTLDIQAATVPDFATTDARPTVTFRVLDGSGNPIDIEAELATTTTFPNLSSPGRAPTFTLAMLDQNDDYVSYYSTTTNPRDYTYIPDPEVVGEGVTGDDIKALNAPAPRTQSQAIAVTRGPNLTAVGERVYRFTFPAPTTPTAGLDRTKTHTVAGWVVRRPNASDTDVASDSFNFVPSGTATVQKIETITDQGCNRCHGFVQAHGTRRGVQFCITCHSPLTGDPETNRTVDFKVMIHKIHYGSGLPSVRQKHPYYIVGFGQRVLDFSDVAFPWHDHGVQHCTVCHQGEDQDNWRTKASPKACTACHDNVQFASAPGLPRCATLTAANKFQDCMHDGGEIAIPNPSDGTSCRTCHRPDGLSPVEKFHHGD